MQISTLTYGNREFEFAKKLSITVTKRGTVWIYETKKYNIMGYEENKEDAFFAFRETFDACWEHIACEDDGNLTEGAQKMKAALKSLVTNIRQTNGLKNDKTNKAEPDKKRIQGNQRPPSHAVSLR